jgi:Cdc6-like AAA superfamily ATPase
LEDVPPSVNLTGMVDNVQLLIDNFFMRGSGNKLCSVTGLAGMGKSALARYAVSLIQERVLLDGGCIYVNCRGIREIDVLFEKTMKAIR